MKQIRTFSVSLILISSFALSACGSIDNYSLHHGTYDRNKLCDILNRQLMYYDDSSYYSSHPISQTKLNSIYEEYKVNGCDK